MKKYLTRMRMRGTNKAILPYIMDRWKGFVRIRKLISYQLRYCENQCSNVRADLQRAFLKWKNDHEKLTSALGRLPRETLVEIGIRSTQQVGKCSEQLAENQSISNHLVLQRDEFLNYYIKG